MILKPGQTISIDLTEALNRVIKKLDHLEKYCEDCGHKWKHHEGPGGACTVDVTHHLGGIEQDGPCGCRALSDEAYREALDGTDTV
jgi:hypothetical protein